MAGVGRDLLRSSSPTSLPKQVHLKQVGEERIQTGFEDLQRRRLHNLSGKVVPGLCPPQSKEIFPHIEMDFLVFQFVPVAPCPIAGHHWKEPGPIVQTPAL